MKRRIFQNLLLPISLTIKNHQAMKALVESISEKFAKFNEEAAKRAEGNKAAGVRARKISLEIEKALKEFRKASVK